MSGSRAFLSAGLTGAWRGRSGLRREGEASCGMEATSGSRGWVDRVLAFASGALAVFLTVSVPVFSVPAVVLLVVLLAMIPSFIFRRWPRNITVRCMREAR